MNRRNFLKTTACASALGLFPSICRSAQQTGAAEPGSDALLKIVEKGLGRADKPKNVIVVGAGMAGLVAAYELLRAGHRPVLLEAQQRVGGRVQTLREQFTHGLYAEAGAMRIPKAHALTLAYVENAFARGASRLETTPFLMSNPNAYCFVRNKKHRWRDVFSDPDCLGFQVKESERGKTPAQLWEETIRPVRQLLEKEGEQAWEMIREKYDAHSTRAFLQEHGWSEEAIQMFGIVENQQSRLNNSVVALLRSSLTESFKDLISIAGGMDLLPRSFLPKLARHITFGAKVEALEQSPQSVTVHYRDALRNLRRVTADRAIITLPFPLLRHVEGIEQFSYGKQTAIQGLNYNESGKILLQCRRRFWEEDDKIFGGGTQTDLSIRSVWYPEQGKDTGRGVLLASYTWGRDAQSWGHLSPEERIRQAVEGLARIHPQIAEESMVEVGTSVMWQNEPYAGGAFALFNPTQETRLHKSIRQAEGRFHFAGEHTSLTHRWIQGAVESGLRAAFEVHQAASP